MKPKGKLGIENESKQVSSPRKWLYRAGTVVVVYLLWAALPKVEIPDEPPLISDTLLLERIHELESFEGLPEKFTKKEKKIAKFGKLLFFDPRLSSNSEIACASCHQPAFAFSEPKPVASGIDSINRNTPPLINLAQNSWFFWDGRSDSLASQAFGPLFHPKEMGLTPVSFVKKVGALFLKEYEQTFGKFPNVIAKIPEDGLFHIHGEKRPISIEQAAYGLATVSSFTLLDDILSRALDQKIAPAALLARMSLERTVKLNEFKNKEPITAHNLTTYQLEQLELVLLNSALALEQYQKGLIAKQSPFDNFLRNVKSTRDIQTSLTTEFGPEELDGLKIFVGQGNCTLCHSGNNFTDQGFHNIGLGLNETVDLEELPIGRAQGVVDVLSSNYNCNSNQLKKRRKALGIPNQSEGCKELNYLAIDNRELVGAFKTPTLRNVELTAPYMHDGRMQTLEEVIEHYDTLNVRTNIGHREESLKPLGISKKRKIKLIAFLRSLTSPIKDLTED